MSYHKSWRGIGRSLIASLLPFLCIYWFLGTQWAFRHAVLCDYADAQGLTDVLVWKPSISASRGTTDPTGSL